jgi:hypothetical protein
MSEIELQIVTRVLSGPLAGDVEVPGLAALETGLPTNAGGHV